MKNCSFWFSIGGELTLLLGTTANKLLFENGICNSEILSQVNAIADLDVTLSFVHLESRKGHDSNVTSEATDCFGNRKAENPVLWKMGSSLTYVYEKIPPTLFKNCSCARMYAEREDYI
ncbi:hypothetical protein [uncultured Maribacter sp.]|uniref:hypothetical protein n=1 Tax=uncultured Maribacter sp. TaxID=431308 RepID=UPI0030D83830